MNTNFKKICEAHGWDVVDNGEWTKIVKASPAGELVRIRYKTDEFVESLAKFAEAYNADEHAEKWIPVRGKAGTPGTIRELLDDAEAIGRDIKALAADIARDEALAEERRKRTELERAIKKLSGTKMLEEITFGDLVNVVSATPFPVTAKTVCAALNTMLDKANDKLQRKLDDNIDIIVAAAEEKRKKKSA